MTDEPLPRLPAEVALLVPGLVHEMRQPLMGIKHGLGFLAQRLDPGVVASENWRLLASQVERLEEILDTYRALLTPDGDEAVSFDAGIVVHRAVELVRFRSKELGSRFSVVIDPELPLVRGAPNALLHAVTNLLLNAIDAVHDSAAARVHVCVRSGPGVQVRVSDDGAGIPEELRDRIFEAGFSTKPAGQGTGMGLSIAQKMLEASQGRLWLSESSDPDRLPWARTELCVELPVAEIPVADGGPRPRRVEVTPDVPVPAPPPPELLSRSDPKAFAELALTEFRQAAATSGRVLVVDDEAVVLAVFANFLPSLGLEFELAESAEDAAPLFVPGRFNLAILDKNLPGGSGIDLLRDLRQVDPQVEVLIITAYPTTESVLEAMRLGACGYLEKPINNLEAAGALIRARVREQALRARTARLRSRLVGLSDELLANAPPEKRELIRKIQTSHEPPPLSSRVALLASDRAAAKMVGLRRVELVPVPKAEELARVLDNNEIELVALDPSVIAAPLDSVAAIVEERLGAASWLAVSDTVTGELAREAMDTGAVDFLALDPPVAPSVLSERISRAVARARNHRADRRLIQLLLDIDIDNPDNLDSSDEAREERAGPPAAATPEADEKRPLGDVRALIVDDDSVVTRVFQEALSIEGCTVSTASTGEKATSLLDRQPFDLLIVDKNLPGMDGVEVIRWARQRDPRLAIVLITGYASTDSAEAVMPLGISEYVVKPFDIAALATMLEPVISRQRLEVPEVDASEPLSTRVLLAEPDAANRQRLTDILAGLGFEAVAVSDVGKAVADDPGAAGAVVNHSMCDAAGKNALLERRRRDPRFRIVAVTRRREISEVVAAISLGAVTHVAPGTSDTATMRAALHSALGGGRPRHEGAGR